jgi:hypothetical protein
MGILMKGSKCLGLAGVVFALTVVSLPAVVGFGRVTAATPSHPPSFQRIFEDRVWNYDFSKDYRDTTDVPDNKYDWPVALFFTNGGTVDVVKHLFKPYFPNHMSQTREKDVPDWVWDRVASAQKSCAIDSGAYFCDTDKGMKDYACSAKNDNDALSRNKGTNHFRIYAPNPSYGVTLESDTLYSPRWSYYVYATAHEDHNECQWKILPDYNHGTKWFGNSERAENWLAQKARELSSGIKAVYPDSVWMANREQGVGPMVIPGTGMAARWDGNHAWLSNGRATRIVLKSSVTASSVPPGEPYNPYPSAAVTRYYNYHLGTGSGDHWATTGPGDLTYDIREETMGFLEPKPVPGTAPLYECDVNVSENFLSRDESCAPGDNDGIAGYIYTSPSAGTPRTLYSCEIEGELYESITPTCEGFTLRGTLGYMKTSGQLARYAGGGVDHHVTTGRGPAGANLEMFYGQLLVGPYSDRHALYSCRKTANSRDHFLSYDRECEGQEALSLEGYAYDSPPSGVPTTPIYRCSYSGGHFVSNQSSCEGYTPELFLGYTYNP